MNLLLPLIIILLCLIVFMYWRIFRPEDPRHGANHYKPPSYLEEKIWYESELNFLFNFAEKLISAAGAPDVIKCITEAAHNFLPIERTVFLAWNKEPETFTVAYAIGWDHNPADPAVIGQNSICGFAAKNRDILVVPDLAENQYLSRIKKEPFLQKAFICVPIAYKNELLGVLFVCDKKTPGSFTAREVSVVKNIARNGAIILQNVRMYEQASKRALELKSAYDELQAMQDKLIQSEKLKAIGQLASGVAHEMRNPIGTIMQGVEYLEQIVPPEYKEQRDTISILKSNVMRADRIVISLLDFSRPAKLELRPEDIRRVLEDSVDLVKADLKRVTVAWDIPQGLPLVLVDKNKMMQVFINIFINAAHAMPQGGHLYIRVFRRDPRTIVEIEDTGVGIAEEDLKRIFDPFFTTKGPGKGTGLGLSVCRNIITMHDGSIEVASRQGTGTTVTIALKPAQ